MARIAGIDLPKDKMCIRDSHKRVRGKISGTPERPRLNVFRSETNIYAQIIDDVNGKTLVSASSLEKDFSCDGTKDVYKRQGQRHRGG